MASGNLRTLLAPWLGASRGESPAHIETPETFRRRGRTAARGLDYLTSIIAQMELTCKRSILLHKDADCQLPRTWDRLDVA
jgi:hypothetical protein